MTIRVDVWIDSEDVYRIKGRACLYAVLRHPEDMQGTPAVGLRAYNREDLVTLVASVLTMAAELPDGIAKEATRIAMHSKTGGPSRKLDVDVLEKPDFRGAPTTPDPDEER